MLQGCDLLVSHNWDLKNKDSGWVETFDVESREPICLRWQASSKIWMLHCSPESQILGKKKWKTKTEPKKKIKIKKVTTSCKWKWKQDVRERFLSFWGCNYLSKEVEDCPWLGLFERTCPAQDPEPGNNAVLPRNGLNTPEVLPGFDFFDSGIIQKHTCSFKQIYCMKGGLLLLFLSQSLGGNKTTHPGESRIIAT